MLRFARLLVLLSFAVMAHPATAAPPNIVMIISDDQAWTDYGLMGHPEIRTPRLDRLAKQSAVFPRGYVPSSLCRPSLATLITGLYPHQHKITGNDPPKGTDRSAMLKHIQSVPTLPRLLAERGYVSLQTGKWWEGNPSLGGFTAGMTHGDPTRGGRHGDVGLQIGRQGMQPISDFLDQRGEKPFFIWYAPFLPHDPHTPPERLLEKYAAPGKSVHIARYQAMCEWFDETCGQLLDELDQRGLSENTLVVYVTDNGWIQREDSRGFAPKSKRSPYDGGIRTPIMLRWPGKIEPARYETLVSSIDLVPTILHAVGIEPPAELPGLNLLEVAASEGKSGRTAIFGEIFEHDVPDIDDPSAGLLYRWGIEGDWKLIVPADRSESPELYHLGDDPHETADLAAKQPERVSRLTNLIDDWWTPRAK